MILKEKEESERKRESLLNTISRKRTFNSLMDARNTVDLTNPGDVVVKRRQIRENLRESTNKAEFHESLLRTGILSAFNKPSSQPSSEPQSCPPTPSQLSSTSSESIPLRPTTSAEVSQLHNRLSRLADILQKLVGEISKGKGRDE